MMTKPVVDKKNAPPPLTRRLLQLQIPAHVLAQRGPLTIHQSLCVWLCDRPAGPRLSQAEAAAVLGFTSRAEVGVHIGRARETLAHQKTRTAGARRGA